MPKNNKLEVKSTIMLVVKWRFTRIKILGVKLSKN